MIEIDPCLFHRIFLLWERPGRKLGSLTRGKQNNVSKVLPKSQILFVSFQEVRDAREIDPQPSAQLSKCRCDALVDGGSPWQLNFPANEGESDLGNSLIILFSLTLTHTHTHTRCDVHQVRGAHAPTRPCSWTSRQLQTAVHPSYKRVMDGRISVVEERGALSLFSVAKLVSSKASRNL